MKYQSRDNYEYKKIIITKNMKKSIEKNAQTNSIKNIIQKNKKHDDYHKNQNIILKKKDITDISINKIQKK